MLILRWNFTDYFFFCKYKFLQTSHQLCSLYLTLKYCYYSMKWYFKLIYIFFSFDWSFALDFRVYSLAWWRPVQWWTELDLQLAGGRLFHIRLKKRTAYHNAHTLVVDMLPYWNSCDSYNQKILTTYWFYLNGSLIGVPTKFALCRCFIKRCKM